MTVCAHRKQAVNKLYSCNASCILCCFQFLPKNFKREEVKKIENELRKKYLNQHEDLSDIVVVYSSHGASIRPKIAIRIVMDKKEILAKVNVAERSELKKYIIIGKQNLGKFLVDVNK